MEISLQLSITFDQLNAWRNASLESKALISNQYFSFSMTFLQIKCFQKFSEDLRTLKNSHVFGTRISEITVAYVDPWNLGSNHFKYSK